MDNRKLNLLFQIMAMCGNYGDFDFNSEYILDSEIIDCQFKLYMSMLIDSEEEAKKRFEEFKVAYSKLSKEKQDYIKQDLKRMFEEQDKNNKEKEKKL